MATLVLVCWLLVVILMPPVLYLWETHLLGTKTVLFRKVERIRGKRKSRKADSEANSEEDESLQVCGIFKICSVDIHSKLVLVLNKFTLFVIKIRWVLMGIWLVLFITSIYGVANLEADKNIPTVFSKSNRLEEAMKLGQKNAYSRDQLCTLCHPLRIRSENFFTENWNESREDVREISDQQKFYSRLVLQMKCCHFHLKFHSFKRIIKSQYVWCFKCQTQSLIGQLMRSKLSFSVYTKIEKYIYSSKRIALINQNFYQL